MKKARSDPGLLNLLRRLTPAAMTIAAAVVPAGAVAARDARPADHGARGTTDHRADRTGNHGAGARADRGAGDGAFITARRIGGEGQGGERRQSRGDEKFAHGYPPNDRFEGTTRQQEGSSARKKLLRL